MFVPNKGQMKQLLLYTILTMVALGCSQNCQQHNTGYIKFINSSNHTIDCYINGKVCARIGPNDSLVHSQVPTGTVAIGFLKVGLEMNTMPLRTQTYQISTCDTVLAFAQPQGSGVAAPTRSLITSKSR
jgi:hypothetical protein